MLKNICEDCQHKTYCNMAHCPASSDNNESNIFLTACSDFKSNRQSNADLIRAMTDAELSVWLSKISACCEFDECPAKDAGDEPSGFVKCTVGEDACITAWLDWLKQEVDDG